MKFVGFLPWGFSNTHHRLVNQISYRLFESLTLSKNQMCLRYLVVVASCGSNRNCLMFLEKTLSSCCLQELLQPFSAWGPDLILLMVHLVIADIEQLPGSSVLTRSSFAISDLCYTGADSTCHRSRGFVPLYMISLTLWVPFLLFEVPMIWIWR